MIESAASLTKCTNCGADSADVYCARCGEKQPGHHDLSVSHFAHEVFHELAHVDSTVFTTLRDLITKPGFLTLEYFAGRKSRYIPPLRLFLTLFALQFLAFTLYTPAAVYKVASFEKFDKAGALTKLLENWALKRHLTRERNVIPSGCVVSISRSFTNARMISMLTATARNLRIVERGWPASPWLRRVACRAEIDSIVNWNHRTSSVTFSCTTARYGTETSRR